MKNWKLILAILTANVVLMAAGYTMLIPFLSECGRCKNVERRDFFHNLSNWRYHGAYLG